MNDKSKVVHSGMGMDGAIMPSMQRVFVGNGANVPQMQAIPSVPTPQQTPVSSSQQSSQVSPHNFDNK